MFLYRLLGGLLAAVLGVLAFILASVFLAIIAAVGVVAFAWLWWRARKAGVRVRGASSGGTGGGRGGSGTVIEGEYRVEDDKKPLR